MNKTLVLFLVISAVGFSYAYAENITIDIPHEFGYNECMTFKDQNGTPFTQCVWEGIPANPLHLSTENSNGCEDGYDRDYITQECKSVELIIIEAKEMYEQSLADNYDRLSPAEKIILSLEEEQLHEPLSEADQQLLEKLKKLGAVCSYDIAQFQTYEEFDIPTETVIDPITGEPRIQIYKDWSLKNLDLKTNHLLKKIDLAVEACLGQTALKTQIIGVGTTNKIVDVWGAQRYHAEHTYKDNEFAGTDFNKVKADLYMKEDGIYQTYQPSIRDTICNSQHFTQAFKNQHACPKPEYVDTIVRPHLYNPFGDDGRQLLEDLENYKDGNESQQKYKVVADAINKAKDSLK